MSKTQKVLVIDDDRHILSMMTMVLEDEGYRVEAAANGLEGLQAVERGMPDLILLDMKMPVMDGWEFAREFRAKHDEEAPIVVVTAAADAGARAQDIDAAGWLEKPFDLDSLLNLVARHIRQQRTAS